MTFFGHLSRVPAERCAIATPSTRVSFGELCSAAEELAGDFTAARVVLCTDRLLDAVTTLAACDGVAEVVALTSAWQPAEAVLPLIELAQPHVVISSETANVFNAGLPDDLLSFSPQDAARAVARKRSGSRLQNGGTGWVVTTSGTTGKPKMVQHSFAGLTRSTKRDLDRGKELVWGMIYDFSRFAGLQVVLQSLLGGACLAVPPFEASLDDKLAFLANEGCTHLSATPTMMRKILMSPAGAGLPLRQITLGGEIADTAILTSLSRAFPEARITHVFASTEAGVGFSVSDKREGFPVSYLSSPPSGIGLRIDEGRLWVRNEHVGAHYLGGQGVLSRQGWVDTGDLVEADGDRVHFRGRESGVINIGGDKVHPEEVERALLSHPDVLLARVYAKANPIMGALVAADVVPGPGAPSQAELRASILAHLKDYLERHMIPASLRFVENFDTNTAGKLRRNA